MKIIDVSSLAIPEIKVVRFKRFTDERGYFTETYRESDLSNIIADFKIKQINESKSQKGALRGLHAQWDPYMGKLVRTVYGHMVDLVLDIRLNSPTFGKIIAYDMPTNPQQEFDTWIWIPVGFVHGNFYLEDSAIEYLCTDEYNPQGEVTINPLSEDLDWSLTVSSIKNKFDQLITSHQYIQSPKDKQGLTLKQWLNSNNKDLFK